MRYCQTMNAGELSKTDKTNLKGNNTQLFLVLSGYKKELKK